MLLLLLLLTSLDRVSVCVVLHFTFSPATLIDFIIILVAVAVNLKFSLFVRIGMATGTPIVYDMCARQGKKEDMTGFFFFPPS